MGHPDVLRKLSDGLAESSRPTQSRCKHSWALSRSVGWDKDLWHFRCEKCGFTKTEKVAQENLMLEEK